MRFSRCKDGKIIPLLHSLKRVKRYPLIVNWLGIETALNFRDNG